MASKPCLLPGAEPFYFPGGETGCLLIHGFTGTPKEMRGLGETLAAQGYSVLGIRLAGHATQPADMGRVRWPDWLADVETGYHLLRNHSQRIFICGLSMGGVLALTFAAQVAPAGLVVMSTPYDLPPDPRLKFIRWLHYLQPRVAKEGSGLKAPPPGYEHIEYPFYPTRAILELRQLLARMRAGLPRVEIPVHILHSRADEAVTPSNAELIFQHLGSARKEISWIEHSSHNILCDGQQEQVFAIAKTFIQATIQERL
ncbi:MAG: alpha/beta fold hydrolase [Anaerolineales bacterium]|nr:alpha/beta fold hydrolase [Anaerolineales bacterium]